jgi:hypothetical protein
MKAKATWCQEGGDEEEEKKQRNERLLKPATKRVRSQRRGEDRKRPKKRMSQWINRRRGQRIEKKVSTSLLSAGDVVIRGHRRGPKAEIASKSRGKEGRGAKKNEREAKGWP